MIRFALVCIIATNACAQNEAPAPVLTVCEALHGLNTCRGSKVVIVGEAGYTFEGTFMEQSCEPDGRIPIQGNRWLSMIAISETGASGVNRGTFPIDDELLYQKLAALRQADRNEPAAMPNGIPLGLAAWQPMVH
jgi:hypothetical protein